MSDDFDDGDFPDGEAYARGSDPSTSHLAAATTDSARLMELVYDVMVPFGEDGCISDEVEARLPGVISHSITPRFKPMMRLGMIEYTGEERVGRTGRLQKVRRVMPEPFAPLPKKPSLRARIRALEADKMALEEELRVYRFGDFTDRQGCLLVDSDA